MVWWIVGSAVVLLTAGGLVVLFAQARVTLDLESAEGRTVVRLAACWLHPALVRVRWRSDASEQPSVGVLFWTRAVGGSQPESDTSAPAREPSPPPPPQTPPVRPAAQQQPATSTPQPRATTSGTTPPRRTPAPPQLPPPRKRPGTLQTVRFALDQRALRRGLLRCGRATLRSLRWPVGLDRFVVHVHSSAGEPWIAGTLSGVSHACACALESHPADRVSIAYSPLFGGESDSTELHLSAHTSAARLVFPVAVLLLSFPYLSAWFTYRRWRRWSRSQV